MYRISSSITLAAVVVGASLVNGASNNFVPDVVFSGSTLNNWKPIGQANWRAQNGEIIGSGSGGWLISDRSYQDVAVFASFRCAASCQTGVLLRAERTPDGFAQALSHALQKQFDPAAIRQNALRFSRPQFLSRFKAAVDDAVACREAEPVRPAERLAFGNTARMAQGNEPAPRENEQ